MSLSKCITEKLLLTFHDLRWYRGHKEGLLVAIFRFRMSILPITRYLRVFRMVSARKRRLPFLSSWLTNNEEVAKLTWPSVTDIKIPRYTYILCILLLVSIAENCEVSSCRCSYYEHLSLLWGEVTWRDLVTWLWAWSEIFTTCAKTYEQVSKNSGASRRRFIDIWEEPQGSRVHHTTGRVSKHHPDGAG